jgi:hypothetical protein
MGNGNTTPHEIGIAGETLLSAQDVHKAMTARRLAERSKEASQEHDLAQAKAEELKRLKVPIQITPEAIASFMKRVQQAADRGEAQILILRFPSDLCTDSGRAINNSLAGWEETLVGVPKQIYEVWLEKLKPHGFSLRAEVLDFPHGMPGDIGLFCRW